MIQKIKVGAVNYLNTKPLIYGFEQGMMKDEIDLIYDHPANIAAGLLNKQIDIGLVPVAVIPALQESFILSDYCIGCTGEVYSVSLFSDVPLAQVNTVLLDYQSKTSVALLKILLASHWQISPVLINAPAGYEKKISGTTAGLIIGDRAISQHGLSKYSYDLGTAWYEMTGLPFVFAAWVSTKEMDEKFKKDFNNANKFGLEHLPAVIKNIPNKSVDLETYFTKNISYELDNLKELGLQLFLKYISNAGV